MHIDRPSPCAHGAPVSESASPVPSHYLHRPYLFGAHDRALQGARAARDIVGMYATGRRMWQSTNAIIYGDMFLKNFVERSSARNIQVFLVSLTESAGRNGLLLSGFKLCRSPSYCAYVNMVCCYYKLRSQCSNTVDPSRRHGDMRDIYSLCLLQAQSSLISCVHSQYLLLVPRMRNIQRSLSILVLGQGIQTQ